MAHQALVEGRNVHLESLGLGRGSIEHIASATFIVGFVVKVFPVFHKRPTGFRTPFGLRFVSLIAHDVVRYRLLSVVVQGVFIARHNQGYATFF